jgi:diguanylate cyclase (GGDEF)-like protein
VTAPVADHDRRVLVVDDEEALRRLSVRVLERAGFECTQAGNVVEARERLAEGSFALALCDINMPGESGIDLLRDISAGHPDTATLMMTALDNPNIAETAIECGAYGYMVKPVQRNQLLIGVTNALHRRRLEIAARDYKAQLEQALQERSAALAKERELREETERQAEEVARQAAENARLVVSLGERQALLEKLARIQRSISSRAALEHILDSIVEGAQELLGDQIVALRLIDPADPDMLAIVASRGVDERLLGAMRRSRIGHGAGGLAVQEEQLVIVEQYVTSEYALGGFAAAGTQSAMAAPVTIDGRASGSLVSGSTTVGRTYSAAEQEALEAFAETASIALTDARTLEQVHEASHDRLTGLPTRNRFVELVEQSVSRTASSGATCAVLMFDLDRFGVVNETLGHEAGDELLKQVAERVRGCVHESDAIARLGGDDFAILLEDVVERADPDAVAVRIIETLRAPFVIEDRDVAVSASVGVASGHESAEELLRNADIAMYKAQGEGKGRYERFRHGMRAGLLQHLELEGDLQRAVENDEFVVHYQPIVSLGSREVMGFEALVRWQHPQRGLIPPLAFIPLAEEMGLIDRIGRSVLKEACEQAARWSDEHPCDPPLFVTVNLSGSDLDRPDLVSDVQTALTDASLPASQLVLEITETVLMRDADHATRQLEKLRTLGVRLAIDDFGTGYSSLHYLRRFPLDILKIAKPFVDGLGSGPEQAALVKTIIELATGFELEVVAEGIEKSRQLAELMRLGCDLGQGFLYAVPADKHATAALIAQAGSGYGRLSAGGMDLQLPPKADRRRAA